MSNNNGNSNDSESAAEFVATVRAEHVAMKEWYNNNSNSAAASLREKYGPKYPDLWKEVLNWPGWKETRRAYLQAQQQQQSSNNNNTSRKRKSRWGSAASEPLKPRGRDPTPIASHNIPALPLPGLPAHTTPEQQRLQAELRQVGEKLQHVERDAARTDALPSGHPDRSPSPPPSEYYSIAIVVCVYCGLCIILVCIYYCAIYELLAALLDVESICLHTKTKY